jgi:hypothetical protein
MLAKITVADTVPSLLLLIVLVILIPMAEQEHEHDQEQELGLRFSLAKIWRSGEVRTLVSWRLSSPSFGFLARPSNGGILLANKATMLIPLSLVSELRNEDNDCICYFCFGHRFDLPILLGGVGASHPLEEDPAPKTRSSHESRPPAAAHPQPPTRSTVNGCAGFSAS